MISSNEEYALLKNTFTAIKNIRPKAQFTLFDDRTFQWDDKLQEPPLQTEIDAELKRMEDEWLATEYQRLRAPEYPAVTEQLDMLWHAMDTDPSLRIEPFYSAIKAVKDQFPKV